jgi:AmmeMemoRadiSam system protein B
MSLSIEESPGIRPAAVAGYFYPDDPATLAAMVDGFVDEAARRHGPAPDAAPPKAMIVPHAGFIYSGAIAASAYVRLRGAKGIERVVIVGPAHRVAVRGLAQAGASAFATPLGEVPVDTAAFAQVPSVLTSARAHAQEHSLEVQLPFLQRVLPDARIVPMVVGHASPAEVADVLETLWGGPETLILVSSDLSHYLSYTSARALDSQTAARVTELDDELDGERACGVTGIRALVALARRHHLRAELLDLRSSGDTAGDKARVVGYAAFAFVPSSSQEVSHARRS